MRVSGGEVEHDTHLVSQAGAPLSLSHRGPTPFRRCQTIGCALDESVRFGTLSAKGSSNRSRLFNGVKNVIQILSGLRQFGADSLKLVGRGLVGAGFSKARALHRHEFEVFGNVMGHRFGLWPQVAVGNLAALQL